MSSGIMDIIDDMMANNPSGFSDLIVNTNGSNASVTTPGTATIDQNHPGQSDFYTGTQNVGRCSVSVSNVLVHGGGFEFYEMLINIPTLANGTQDYIIRMGTGDQNASASAGVDHNNGVYFEYQGNAQANWVLKTANGGTRTSTTSSTAVATGWTKLRIEVTGSNKAEYFINGTSVGTITTNIPTVNSTGQCFKLEKKVGTTGVRMFLDYYQMHYEFATAR
jgi:hypothetical protein